MGEHAMELMLDMGNMETSEEKENAVESTELATVEKTITDLKEGLNEQEYNQVIALAEKIDVSNSTLTLSYGEKAQKGAADFSDTILSTVRNSDYSDVGNMLTGLVGELKGFDEEDKGGILGLFRKGKNKLQALQMKYESIDKTIGRICNELENHRLILMKDIHTYDTMYEKNLTSYKELSMYILAGKIKLKEVEEQLIPQLLAKAKETGKPEDAQRAKDVAEQCNRFDKKLHDLELTRQVSIQMGPQIRLVQGNGRLMVEKIQTTVNNTIPLWKNQVVLAIGLAHSEKAIQAQRTVTDVTNDLLRKNADTLKMSTIAVAKESERGIVDIETLRHTNSQLIETLNEVMQIQTDGKQKRREAEKELTVIENQLKQKLLEIRNGSNKE